MMQLIKGIEIPANIKPIEIEDAIGNRLLQIAGAIAVARRVAEAGNDDALMNMLWGVEGGVSELQQTFETLRERWWIQSKDIKRLRQVLDRISPDALAAAGIFPLADRDCSDAELREFVDGAEKSVVHPGIGHE